MVAITLLFPDAISHASLHRSRPFGASLRCSVR
jgi:hypothetical protein